MTSQLIYFTIDIVDKSTKGGTIVNEIMKFIKLNSKIFRNTQMYLDKVLKKYGLSSGNFRYLFIIEMNEGIGQNRLSREVGNDKAMSARTITKLVNDGFVKKVEDQKDARACNLYLTEKGWNVIPKLHEEIGALEQVITGDLTEDEKIMVMCSLNLIYQNTQRVIEQGELEIEK